MKQTISMTERIGKLSLIFGTILSILCAIAGLIFLQTDLFSDFFGNETGYYPVFTLMPFVAMFLSHLTAWLICLIKTKKNSELPQETPNTIGVLFKSYFYLWIIITIAIALGSFIFLNFHVYNLPMVFGSNALWLSIAWLCTVIVCIMVWAAVNAWKATEAAGVVVAIIAFLVLAGTSTLVGALYYDNADSYSVARNNQAREAAYDAVKAYEINQAREAAIREAEIAAANAAANSEQAEYVDESESGVDRALRFMRFKFELENEQRAIDLIRNWTYWYSSWKESDYGYSNSRDYFNGPMHFHRSKGDFYLLINGNMRNNSVLESFVTNNHDKTSQIGNILYKRAFERSGASDCLKILLWAYDDIYSKENSDSTLREIYNYMMREPENSEYYYGVKESHYEGLRPYMSDDVVLNINRICRRNTDDVEWATGSMATWAYSFWARRHNDKVDKVVYRILKIVERVYN